MNKRRLTIHTPYGDVETRVNSVWLSRYRYVAVAVNSLNKIEAFRLSEKAGFLARDRLIRDGYSEFELHDWALADFKVEVETPSIKILNHNQENNAATQNYSRR